MRQGLIRESDDGWHFAVAIHGPAHREGVIFENTTAYPTREDAEAALAAEADTWKEGS
jgi:hypothetical protein